MSDAEVEAIETAVHVAVAEYRDWFGRARPSAEPNDRVRVKSLNATVLRRPFKRRGQWVVTWAGVARLTKPQRIDGQLTFTANWNRS